MTYQHESGLKGAWDRAAGQPLWDSVVTREGHFGQAAEMIEVQTILQRKLRAIANLVARDGDRIEGGDILIDNDAGTATLTAGRIYVDGRVLSVAGATLSAVPMAGAVTIGVRLAKTWITELDFPPLKGLEPGTLSEGEKGAARGIVSLTWGFAGDGVDGSLYSVYLLKDGVAIDQSPPPNLTGVNAQIRIYDFDANGNYVVTGCRVTALGKDVGDQVFSIEAGVANVNGYKRTRHVALRHREPETSDLFRIATEIHTLGASPSTILLNHGPVATINEVLIQKEVTETVTRGGVANTMDNLVNTGVLSIVEVKMGPTTYVAGTDYVKSGDKISWAPGGNEPSSGSSYTVKYHYLGVTTPTASTATTVTVAGGVNGGQAQIDYEFHLPRVDIIGLDEDGLPVYIKGVSSRNNPLPPLVPSDVLPLAMVVNNWIGTPEVINIGVRAYTMADIDRIYRRLVDALDLIALERLQRDIDSREPVAKNGVFVDPFTSDRYRDAGEPQTAAVFGGLVRLAIDPTFHPVNLPAVTLLNWTEAVAVEQPLATRCTKINEYMNFNAMPAAMTLNPPVDYWTQKATQWTSDSTQAVAVPVTVSTSQSRSNAGQTVTTTTTRETVEQGVAGQTTELLDFLRQINVDFEIRGFFAGEILSEMKFDDILVTPSGPLVANGGGTITGSFTIPANVPAGSKAVIAKGAGGSQAAAVFVGQGTIETTLLRRVITTTVASVSRFIPSRMNDDDGAKSDPIAQTFMLPAGRHIAGVNLKICAIGDPNNAIVLEVVEVENGIPTTNVVAQAFYDMNVAVIGAWTAIRFAYPIWLPGGVEYAFVVKTDDGVHSIATAALGDFVAETQTPVAAQPYSVGTMLTSANARTWTPHQAEDVCFQLIEAVFAPVTKTVNVGTFNVVDMSDLVIRAEVELPTAVASMHFEVEIAGGMITLLRPGQAWELQEYYTGAVQVRAVLAGSANVSPVLFPVILAVSGKLKANGTYVSRAFDMGTAVKILARLKTRIPTGSAINLDVDAAGGAWAAMTQTAQAPLTEAGWIERKYEKAGHNANPVGRLRISLSGTPSARPLAYDLRAISAP